MTTPADIPDLAQYVIHRELVNWRGIPPAQVSDDIIAALDAAGYDIVARDPRPATCPNCGSDNPRIAGGRRTEPCPDPWHGEGR